nr:MAG TPA: hypothetical protein [Caudoviricetes sp.]DAN42483.1 MAG TPA: hypothetical protein [Caudoviricetes sp.]DAR51422.1 MAG TPA: hypothetical protein [Caudoviricetes sp.]DAS19287.1 MAG TPA: hypothetical protein [Caudoviricetes sp.]
MGLYHHLQLYLLRCSALVGEIIIRLFILLVSEPSMYFYGFPWLGC